MNGTNVIIGDLNFPDIDWANGISGSKGRGFFEAATAKFMEQHVHEPTHLSGNILDLILCNQEGIISMVKTLGRIGKSDHETLSFKIKIDNEINPLQRVSWNFRRAKFIEMRDSVKSVDWMQELEGKCADTMWISIRGCIKSLMETYIPKRKIKKNLEPKWMTTDIR